MQNNPLSRTDPSGFTDKEKKKKKKHKVQSDTSSKSPTEKPTAQNQSTKSGVTGRDITAEGKTKDYRGGETGGVMAGTHGGFFGNLWSGTKSLSSAAYNRLNYESGLILNASGDLLSAPDRVLNWATGTDEYDRFNMAVNTSFIGDDMIVGGLAALTRSGRVLKGLGGLSRYDVGSFNDIKRMSTTGDTLDIHHVGQKHIMSQLIDGYNPNTAPSISIPELAHRRIPNLRGSFDGSARDLLANDIMNLRKYTDAPNSSLQELIQLNKQQYPSIFNKGQ